MQSIDTSSIVGRVWSIWTLPTNIFRCYVVHLIAVKTQQTWSFWSANAQGDVSTREILFMHWLPRLLFGRQFSCTLHSITHTCPHSTCAHAIQVRKMTLRFIDRALIIKLGFPERATTQTDHVLLTQKQQLLMVGQPYRVTISIDMPESEQNIQLGMFMVCAESRDKATKLRSRSCRTAPLSFEID